jgi:hypothetical protein
MLACFSQEYLYHLGAAIRDLAPQSYDSHLSALEVGNSSGSLEVTHPGHQVFV